MDIILRLSGHFTLLMLTVLEMKRRSLNVPITISLEFITVTTAVTLQSGVKVNNSRLCRQLHGLSNFIVNMFVRRKKL